LLDFRSISNPAENLQEVDVSYLHHHATFGVTLHWRGMSRFILTSTATFELHDIFIDAGCKQPWTEGLRSVDLTTQSFWNSRDTVQYAAAPSVRQDSNG
jgi:hypothetical protein